MRSARILAMIFLASSCLSQIMPSDASHDYLAVGGGGHIYWVQRAWRSWLARRGGTRRMTRRRFDELLAVFPLPHPGSSTKSEAVSRAANVLR
jgi:hypothetical protein